MVDRCVRHLTAAIRKFLVRGPVFPVGGQFGCRCAASLSLAVSGGWGEKSGSRAGCGAQAWRPCTPRPACHRIELWFCWRGPRRPAEAVTEPAGSHRFPRSSPSSWRWWPPTGNFSGSAASFVVAVTHGAGGLAPVMPHPPGRAEIFDPQLRHGHSVHLIRGRAISRDRWHHRHAMGQRRWVKRRVVSQGAVRRQVMRRSVPPRHQRGRFSRGGRPSPLPRGFPSATGRTTTVTAGPLTQRSERLTEPGARAAKPGDPSCIVPPRTPSWPPLLHRRPPAPVAK